MPRQVKRSEEGYGRSRARGVEPAVIPVIQEQATVKKRVVETGKVHIAKRLREYEELVDIPHIHEEVRVERVPVNEFVDESPQVRTEGEITIIPVLEERAVIEKRLFLIEELHIRKERKESHHPQTVKVLKEEVEVKRLRPGQQTGTHAKAAKPRP
jgi:uncharacterized protein (TIGR02271 family)